jgi:hypothetical protein
VCVLQWYERILSDPTNKAHYAVPDEESAEAARHAAYKLLRMEKRTEARAAATNTN